jgi:polysaccharide export outer membrane protein
MRRALRSSVIGAIAALGIVAPLQSAPADNRGIVRHYSAAEFGVPDQPDTETKPPLEYRIAPLDKLSISVLQLPDLPKDQQVDGNGNIHMPLIGDVRAQGMTARQLEEALKKKFGEKYLQAPEVQVLVTDAQGDKVTVDGAVQNPGVYPLGGQRSLVQVIAMAHGLTDKASPSHVAVFRTIKGQRMAAGFDLKKIRKGQQPDPPIYGNDVVVVDGSGIKSTWSTILQSIPLVAVFSAI